jgi:hypothetical protein
MKNCTLFILAFLFAYASSKAVTETRNNNGSFPPPPVIYVNKAASGSNNGTSWANAYTDLQTAIAVASNQQIWVAQGTYYPGISGNSSATFLLKNSVVIYGGFNGTEFMVSQRNIALNPTVLSGDLDVSSGWSGNDAYHVVSTGNTDNTAILDGFIITGGYAQGAYPDSDGGGILCSPTSPGGTIGASIINCDIMGNAGTDGAGVAVLCDNILRTLAPQFVNCRIHNNSALGLGGGLFNFALGSSAHTNTSLVNCLFYGNSGGGSATSIYSTCFTNGLCEIKVSNCTFADNAPGDDIQFVKNDGNVASKFEIYNSIFYGMDLSTDDIFLADYNLGAGPLSGGNNYNLDPLFVNAGAADFHVMCPSPAINTGNNSYIVNPNDMGGNSRPLEGTADIGAFESSYGGPPSITPNASTYDVCDGSPLTLYGSGPGGVVYTWSHGVTDNVPFTPTATETYTVTGTAPNGCVANETVTVTFHNLPSVTASVTNQPVCEGGQTTLTGNGALSYLWDNGVSDGIPFTPASVGWNNYNVVGTDAYGCVSMPWPMSVLVESNVGFTAGLDQDVCSNTVSLTLSGNTGTSTSHSWSTLGTGSFVNMSTLTPDYYFSGADMSLDTVRIVLAATYTACPVTRDTLKLAIVHPTNNYAGPDMAICADAAGTIFYSGSAINYSSVHWSSVTGGGTFTPDQISMSGSYSATAAEITAGFATLQFISYALSSACPNDTDDVQITIHSLPIPTPTTDYTVCQSDSIYLHETITGGTPPFLYTWKTGPPIAIISTANNEYYHPGQTDTYDLQVTDINGCQAVDTFMVTFDPSNDISGTVNVGAGQLTAGTVYLIRYIPQQMVFDTVSYFNLSGSGAYFFPTTAHGNYLVKVVPDTVLFPSLLPTYYGNAFQWDSATVVTHNCATDFTADISMIALLGGTGSGSISGYVLEDVGYGTRIGHNGHDHVMVPGGPLKGIDVKLGKNPAGGIQARMMTDSTGHYAFEDLPNDSYRIYVDIPGLPMDSFYVVNITTATDTAINLNYYADSNSVYPILPTAVGLPSHKYTAASFDVYPNPAKSFTSIRFDVADENKATIRILDVTGKAVLTTELRNLPKGKHEYQLNFNDTKLNSGIYFIEVQTASGVKVMKLVVE